MSYTRFRKKEKEPTQHTDFTIKAHKDESEVGVGFFLLKRAQGGERIRDYYPNKPNTFFLAIYPHVSGVRDVFERIDWTLHRSGTSNNSEICFSDIVRAYELHKIA